MFGEDGANAAQMLGINVGGIVAPGAHGGNIESEEDGTAGEIIGDGTGTRKSGAQSLRGNSKKGRKKAVAGAQQLAAGAGAANFKGKVFNNYMEK